MIKQYMVTVTYPERWTPLTLEQIREMILYGVAVLPEKDIAVCDIPIENSCYDLFALVENKKLGIYSAILQAYELGRGTQAGPPKPNEMRRSYHEIDHIFTPWQKDPEICALCGKAHIKDRHNE